MADLSSLLGAAGIGGTIGQAVVRLELDSKKYTAEMEAAHAKTIASTKAMGSSTSRFSALASSALMGVGVAAVAGAALSIKAAIDANEAHLKLQNTFKNNASLADSSVEAFERQADALRELTGVDDEAIIGGQALLGSMNRTGAEVLKLTPLIVDLATKYDIDLQSAFKAVGKAADGNTGALARYVGAIEPASTKAGQLQNVLDALAKSEGFAADRAKAEPWVLIGQQFEEIAERLGQALLPAIENLAKAIIAIMPFIEGLITGFIQLGHYVVVATKAIGGFYDAISAGVPVTDEQVKLIGDVAGSFIKAELAADKAGASVKEAQTKIQRFAHMTTPEIKEWSAKTKESFETYVINLDKVQEATDFTRKDLRDSFAAMLQHARDLNSAMRTLSREHWINDDFVKFLAEQPDKLILFANSNETQQRRMQNQWELSGEILKNKVNDRLDVMTGILDKMDKSETKHKVIIEYEYVGYDPTKPGMSGGSTAKRP